MIRPTKHSKTGVYLLRKTVPKPLREAAGQKTEWIVNLGTKDPKEAKRKAPEALAQIEALHAAAKAAMAPLPAPTEADILAAVRHRLATIEARAEASDALALAPGEAEETIASLRELAAHLAGPAAIAEEVAAGVAAGPAAPRGPIASTVTGTNRMDNLMRSLGFGPVPGPLRLLAARALVAVDAEAANRSRHRLGDFDAPGPNPAFAGISGLAEAPPAPAPQPAAKPLLAAELLAAWATERNPSKATRTKYARAFATLARILGFDDVRRITVDDVVTFKQARQAEKLKADKDKKVDPKTVKDEVLACGAVCKWAFRNRMLPSNPFAGMAPSALRRGPAPREGYNDEEAARILLKARGEETPWLRWAPWCMAFTGARVGEFAGMNRSHVRQEGGTWIFDFRPTELREGKNATFQRMVPIHPAIIAEGFLEWLPAGDGPLFPDITPDPSGGRVVNGTSMMSRWIRGTVGITDKKKAGSHSWRHRMEDELRKVAGAHSEIQDAVTGRNNPRNAGAGYGRGFRGMPAEVLKVLRLIPSPVPPLNPG